MELFLRVTPEAATCETSRPAPEKVLAGDPVHRTWNIEDDGDGTGGAKSVLNPCDSTYSLRRKDSFDVFSSKRLTR